MTVIVLDTPTTVKLVSLYFQLEEIIADLKDTKEDIAQTVDEDEIAGDLEEMISISYEMLDVVSTPLQGSPAIDWESEEDDEEDYLTADDDVEEDDDDDEEEVEMADHGGYFAVNAAYVAEEQYYDDLEIMSETSSDEEEWEEEDEEDTADDLSVIEEEEFEEDSMKEELDELEAFVGQLELAMAMQYLPI